jgi:hypothetical protein
MEDLVAKNVFGELTLKDVWDVVSEDLHEIEIKVAKEPCSRSYGSWCGAYGRLDIFDNYYGLAESDPVAEFSLDMREKAKVVEDRVVTNWKGFEVYLVFRRCVSVDLSRFLPSSKKPL